MLSWMQRSRSRSVQGAVLSLLMISFVGCATQGRPAAQAGVRAQHRLETAGIVHKTTEAASPTSLDGIYNAAVVNSAVFRKKHLEGGLWPVPANEIILMESFISCDNCPGENCNSKCKLVPNWKPQEMPSDVWVSRADQLLQFCQGLPQNLDKDQVILKIQQLQGLPPQVNQDPCTWMILQVQINVSGLQVPAQFFRPCPDPDPTTTGPCPSDFENPVPAATTDFQAWMAGQAFSSWQIPGGYPWTHLGYTYNWDPEAKSIVGTSEYVIRQGTAVPVMGFFPALPYCTQGRLRCPL
jgi:hypothetical protein